MKKFTTIIIAVFMIFSLVACDKDITPEENQNNKEPSNIEEKLKEGETFENIEFQYLEDLSNTIQELKEEDKVKINYVKKEEEEGKWFYILTDIEKLAKKPELPEKKMLKMVLEGMEEEREATLKESKYGYYIYVLNRYSFEEKENGKSYIIMDYDNDFNIEIQTLPEDLNHEEWKEAITSELKEFGEVHEINPKEHFYPYFHDAYYYYISSAVNKGSVMSMLKEIDGVLFQFKINMPAREAAEGAGSSFWGMLQTIQVK